MPVVAGSGRPEMAISVKLAERVPAVGARTNR